MLFFYSFLKKKTTIFLLVIKLIKIQLLFSLFNKFLFYEFLCIHHCRTFRYYFSFFLNNIRNNENFSPFFPLNSNQKKKKYKTTKEEEIQNKTFCFYLYCIIYNIKIKIKDKTKSSISILKNTKYTLIN